MMLMPLGVSANSGESNKIPDFSMKDRKDVPVEFTWNIDDIFPTPEAFEKEKTAVKTSIDGLDAVAKDWTGSAKRMLGLFDYMNDLMKRIYHLYAYSSHQANADLGDPVFQRMRGEVRMMMVTFHEKLAFMNSDILKLGQKTFDKYLKEEPGLEPYQFGVEQVLRMKEHVLPEEQQKIVSMTGLFSRTSQQASNILNDVELPAPEITLSDGTKVTLNYAGYARHRESKNAADRALVMDTFWKNHKRFEKTFAALIDGGMKLHLFNARAHKYKDCLEAALYEEGIDSSVYLNLIKYVRENIDPLHRFLTLKKELIGVEKLRYQDVYAPTVTSVDKLYTYEEARKIILDMMKPLGKDYVNGLKEAFDNRWIDIYPNKGKESGAYSGGLYGVHPYIKMNYNGTYGSMSTLAHELGHAMHSFFSSKAQHFANHDYATFLAEIASTFNENMLMNYLLESEKDDMFKLFILSNYIEQLRGTIYRQTLFAEFELAMHREVEKGGTLTAEWLDEKYLELSRFYYGHDKGIMEVGDFIANEWGNIPHFYLNYYVFQYSTGIIASMALTNNVLDGGKAEQKKYIEFLSAGGSDFPLEILKRAGVDMNTRAPYDAAFKRFDYLVGQMEILVKRLKKNKKL
jgi:oligoendopeptidase F